MEAKPTAGFVFKFNSTEEKIKTGEGKKRECEINKKRRREARDSDRERGREKNLEN